MKTLTLISRIFVGVLFIISGLIKLNDPIGFSIKLMEYFQIFQMPWMEAVSVALAIFLCTLEIVLGVALLIGWQVRLTVLSLLALIVFFTGLTGFSAITGKVTDCGCFGDAIKLTPTQSFYKDLVLLVFIVILAFGQKHILPILSSRLRSFGIGLSSVASIVAGYYCVQFLPVVDFLPYKIGNNLLTLSTIPEGAPQDSFESKLFYTKNGEIKEFTIKNYPWQDSTWKWVRTDNVLVKEGFHPPIHDLKISDFDGNDYTEDLLSNPEYTLWVVAYDIDKTDRKAFEKISKLTEAATKNNIRSIGLTANNDIVTDSLRHEFNLAFDFYQCDATPLKTMIRTNPGVILLKNGEVIAKFPAAALPSIEDIMNK